MPRGQRRVFPPEFKAKLVLELLGGATNQAELCRKHNLKPQLLAHWKATAVERLHALFQDDGQSSQDLTRRKKAPVIVVPEWQATGGIIPGGHAQKRHHVSFLHAGFY